MIGGRGPRVTDVEYWEARAEEARATAEGFTHLDAQKAMLRIAETYDYIAVTGRKLRERGT
jgi:hypothetical protein